jgi:hypothetical protein
MVFENNKKFTLEFSKNAFKQLAKVKDKNLKNKNINNLRKHRIKSL